MPCSQCLEQGIFIVGGSKSSTNETELIDPFHQRSQCKNENKLKPFPSLSGRHGMVSEYIGNGSAVFCGGENNDYTLEFMDCYRYTTFKSS